MVAHSKSFGARLIDGLNGLLKPHGKIIVPSEWLYDWQLHPAEEPVYAANALPEDARKYLTPENPRLVELKRRYAQCDPDVTTPLVWHEGHVRPEDIAFFRGDNAYVWQVRGTNANIMGYALTTYYVQHIDQHGLLGQLTEDDSFGNFTFPIAGRKISRDLLDSIIEIEFLNRHLSVMTRSNVTILDIGAGYGRLAYRAAAGMPGLKEYLCTDAVPYSTFISEFYLRHRQVADRARVIPLDEIEKALASRKIDIAVNIHSFSECRLEAIEWWVSRLARAGVKNLLIAPNKSSGQRLQTNDLKDFTPILEKHGYRLMVCEPKYRDPVVQQYGISPTYHFLFELR
jgi:hypothetical protein